jgi:hypothetical protein
MSKAEYQYTIWKMRLEIDGHQNWLRVKSSNKEFEWKKREWLRVW